MNERLAPISRKLLRPMSLAVVKSQNMAGRTSFGTRFLAYIRLSPPALMLMLAAHLLSASITTAGTISTVVGTGVKGSVGDGGRGKLARLHQPNGIVFDSSGNLYIADPYADRIRRVDASTGIITTVAGNGVEGFSGDGGPATSANLGSPYAIAIDATGNIYIADTYNNRVRRVDASNGIITTIVGTDDWGPGGDGGPATSAQLNFPDRLALDATGNLYIADAYNYRVRRLNTSTGIITTVAGTGVEGFSGDGRLATSAQLGRVGALAFDPFGNLYIIDTDNARVRRVDATTRIITTIAGNGVNGFRACLHWVIPT